MDVLAESKTPSFGLFSYLQQPPSHHLSTCLSQRLTTTRKPSVSVGRHVLNHMLSLSLYSMLRWLAQGNERVALWETFPISESGDSHFRHSRHSHYPATKDSEARMLNARTTSCVPVRVAILCFRDDERSMLRVRVGVSRSPS